MSSKKYRAPRRAGFTLIELLVVIGIIAVLVALTAAAVVAVIRQGAAAQARSDINGLVTAHGAFRQQFNVGSIPSQLILREDGAWDLTNPVEKRSKLFIESMFPRIQYPVDWNGDGVTNGPHTLMGEECLVFFLGGIPTQTGPNTCLGFSKNPKNPADFVSTTEKYGPFYDFQTPRLVHEPLSTPTAPAAGFFKYRDAYNNGQQPAYYVYLSPVNGKYNTDATFTVTDSRQGVVPYVLTTSPVVKFLNNDSFQIICAGPNGVFGPGGTNWSVANGYGKGLPGSDDLSNFSAVELSAGQQ
jgi:prepilin-type N-terminal cleavage/methylation domain-containing protein